MKPTDAPLPLAPDGRQSAAALEIARGATRLLADLGFLALAEVVLPDGRRADLMGLSASGVVWIVEVKSSVEDFRVDQKWPKYQAYCDRLWFAVGPDFPLDLLPDSTGWIVADRFGAGIMRDAPELKLAAARRRVLTVNLARQATGRLLHLVDPDRKLT